VGAVVNNPGGGREAAQRQAANRRNEISYGEKSGNNINRSTTHVFDNKIIIKLVKYNEIVIVKINENNR